MQRAQTDDQTQFTVSLEHTLQKICKTLLVFSSLFFLSSLVDLTRSKRICSSNLSVRICMAYANKSLLQFTFFMTIVSIIVPAVLYDAAILMCAIVFTPQL